MNENDVRALLQEVCDPEIPILTIEDIGILRDVQYSDNSFHIVITPTYSGCPAMYHIKDRIRETLKGANINNFEIITKLSPAWTTDWMSDEAKLKLKNSGIAPPSKQNDDSFDLTNLFKKSKEIDCPYCNSNNTKLLNEFGSTACKSLHYCNNCSQAFEHFKCH